MTYHYEEHGSGRASRCAVCDRKFGLVRYHSWRTQFCSRKCLDCYRARRASDGHWLPRLEIAFNQLWQRTARELQDVFGSHKKASNTNGSARRCSAPLTDQAIAGQLKAALAQPKLWLARSQR